MSPKPVKGLDKGTLVATVKKKGEAIGPPVRPCRRASCKGFRFGVRWDDGSLTFPCTTQVMHRIEEEGDPPAYMLVITHPERKRGIRRVGR